MPGEPQTVYIQRTYSAAAYDATHASKIIGVWPVDRSALTPMTTGVRACPFHRQQPTTREHCEQCGSTTLLIKYRYESDAVNVLLVTGEIGTLVLDPELPAAGGPVAPEAPAEQAAPATAKRSHRRKEPVAAE